MNYELEYFKWLHYSFSVSLLLGESKLGKIYVKLVW